MNKETKRIFPSGALRDVGDSKYNYYGFRHPLLEQSFAKYMHEHRKMADGTMRDANNWWKGWDKEVSLQSLVRHLEDLQALQADYCVVEIRYKDGRVEKKYLETEDYKDFMYRNSNSKVVENIKIVNAEECCNAIRFNAEAYKLQELK